MAALENDRTRAASLVAGGAVIAVLAMAAHFAHWPTNVSAWWVLMPFGVGVAMLGVGGSRLL